MKRMKRHKIKVEKPEASTSGISDKEEHDLAYYIHDRVELMHQVFSVLKYKEIKAMAPDCVRNLAVGDLQELCTEELLGISSKRLLAILDGAEPPSDTESSSPSPPPDLETISLDSISSDEEILSQGSSKKKKHKHRRRESKSSKKDKDSKHSKARDRESKRSKKADSGDMAEQQEQSTASRAGLTVLELLELQARARAIRAQLINEQAKIHRSESDPVVGSDPSDSEVMIKEEPHDVVEIISSDDETRPKTEVKEKSPTTSPKRQKTGVEQEVSTHTDKQSPTEAQTDSVVTKRVNDLVITVPQSKNTRKIKLNRNKPNSIEITTSVATEERNITIVADTSNASNTRTVKQGGKEKSNDGKKLKKKKNKNKKKKNEAKDSDNDEITLQLSDTEKMDLLEDLEERPHSASTKDSSTDSDDSSDNDSQKDNVTTENEINLEKLQKDLMATNDKLSQITRNIQLMQKSKENTEEIEQNKEIVKSTNENSEPTNESLENNTIIGSFEKEQRPIDESITRNNSTNTELTTTPNIESEDKNHTDTDEQFEKVKDVDNDIEITNIENIPIQEESRNQNENEKVEPELTKQIEKQKSNEETTEAEESEGNQKSDGEVSDRESSEIEAIDLKPEVVTISDEDTSKKNKKDKKKKKDKKSKKEKRKKDFCESSDENFYKDTKKSKDIQDIDIVELSDEIYELSDDSSCYEVEGTVLSKEPTAEEIEALSAKIDEIERQEVVTEDEIRRHEASMAKNVSEITAIGSDKAENENPLEINVESAPKTEDNAPKTAESDNSDTEMYVSWKDRYLESKKVKRVLSTANIVNALRKKNIQLKRKIEESKKIEQQQADEKNTQEQEKRVESILNDPPEGSIEHYNTLHGSTRYVNPIDEKTNENDTEKDENNLEKIENDPENVQNTQENALVTKEMKKDAKQLLKMYKKLLKYNDMNKQTDPNKKKKKKLKKKSKELIQIIKYPN